MYKRTRQTPMSSPTPPKDDMKRIKTKAKLRGDTCISCIFYNFNFGIKSKNGYCAKHDHGKRPNNWCRYHVSRDRGQELIGYQSKINSAISTILGSPGK